MATTKKAVDLAFDYVSELNQRSTLAASISYDTDGSPLIKVGDGSAGDKGGIVKYAPIDWPAKDILGLTSQIYTPHVCQIAVEAVSSAGAEPNDWATKVLLLGLALSRGTRVEIYESANGTAPSAATIDAANLKATWEASAQFPMIDSQ